MNTHIETQHVGVSGLELCCFKLGIWRVQSFASGTSSANQGEGGGGGAGGGEGAGGLDQPSGGDVQC